jgi:predicted Zn finger-like uncharacterized protein
MSASQAEERAVARIFWVTCPKCRGRFYCHYDDFRGKDARLLCPYCGHRFLDSESPQLDE